VGRVIEVDPAEHVGVERDATNRLQVCARRGSGAT
jgi:hypothetical protein